MILFIPALLIAQEFQGEIIYQSATANSNKELSYDKELEAYKKRVAKAHQKEFKLLFNKDISLFKLIEKLNVPNQSNGFGRMGVVYPFENFYKNNKEKRIINKQEWFGQIFLIQDSLKIKPWRILDKTKQIGEYLCRKAVFTKAYSAHEIGKDGALKFVQKEREVVAWFTNQIPVSHGPGFFYGLPGLILEVHDGNTVLLTTEVTLKQKGKKRIQEPKRGKVVSQSEFDSIKEQTLRKARESNNRLIKNVPAKRNNH